MGRPGTEMDLVTLITVIIMVCVATFSCTVFGRFCFEKYCRRNRRSSRKVCPHGGLPDLPCGLCAQLGSDPDFIPRWRPFHPSIFPNVVGPHNNLNYAALLAAERQNAYLQTLGHASNGRNRSPGPTDILESQRELPGPNYGSSQSVPVAMTEESGTFRRLGIRNSFSGKNDLSGIARELENRNLSPIQQTPPDTQFSNELSIANPRISTNTQVSQTSSLGNLGQRRTSSFRHGPAPKESPKKTYTIDPTSAKSYCSIPIPGIKKMFNRHVGTSDLKSPKSEDTIISRPSSLRKKMYLSSERGSSSPILTKAKSVIPAYNESLAPPTTIEIESEKEIDEVDLRKHLGAPGNTTPIRFPLRQSRQQFPSSDEEIFKSSNKSEPPRSAGAGGKARVFKRRNDAAAGGARHHTTDHNKPRTVNGGEVNSKKIKSLEDIPTTLPNYCSVCGHYLMENAQTKNNNNNTELLIDRSQLSQPSYERFQPTDSIEEGEKTSSNSLGSPGINSIIDSLNVVTARNSFVSINQSKDDDSSKQDSFGFIHVPISEAGKFSLELEKRGPIPVSDTMFNIPLNNNPNALGGDTSKALKRKSFDVESSIKSVKSPIKFPNKGIMDTSI